MYTPTMSKAKQQKQETPRAVLSISMPPALKRRLRRQAAGQRHPLSKWARMLLERAVDGDGNEFASRPGASPESRFPIPAA